MSKGWKYGIGLGVVILLLFAGNLLVGSVSIPPADVFRILLGGEGEKASWSFILWESRLPQALTALLCGGALAVCGLMLQTAFKNPLAGPSILGINAGASLGVAFVMLLFGGSITAGAFSLSGFFSVLLGAFIGAMLIMALILFFSTLIKSNIMLLITGIMIGYIASSAIALLNFFATAEGVQSYMIWGLGNFGGVSLQQMPAFALVTIVGLFGSLLLIKSLNALLLGERYAENLGVNIRRVRNWLLVITGLLTADRNGHRFLWSGRLYWPGRAACGPHDIGDNQSQFPIAGHHPEWRCSGTALQSDLRLARRSGYYSLECRHAHYRCAGHHLRYSEPAEAPTIQLSYCRQLDKVLPYYWQDFATALANFCHRHGKVLPNLWQCLGKISL